MYVRELANLTVGRGNIRTVLTGPGFAALEQTSTRKGQDDDIDDEDD